MMVAIQDSILNVLARNFPSHTLYPESVIQDIVLPCFFVDLLPIDIVKINPNQQERSFIVDIQYMTEEETEIKTKNLEMAEQLSQLFSFIEFNGMRVNVSNERFEIIDKILHFLFDLDFIVFGQQEESVPKMGNLNLNQEVIKWDYHK